MTIPMPEPEYAKYRTALPHLIDGKTWTYISVITASNYLRHHKEVNERGKPGWQGYGHEFQVEWLITTTQAEAYADARVREALEEAAEIADRNNDFSTYDAIRALIPADSRPGQP